MDMLRKTLAFLIFSASLFVAVTAWTAPQRFDVRAFGDVGDGAADDQPAITKAVEAVAKNKGGTLYFPRSTTSISRTANL